MTCPDGVLSVAERIPFSLTIYMQANLRQKKQLCLVFYYAFILHRMPHTLYFGCCFCEAKRAGSLKVHLVYSSASGERSVEGKNQK
jgi:hypothetical protein